MIHIWHVFFINNRYEHKKSPSEVINNVIFSDDRSNRYGTDQLK